jgi:tetratricopeptide (TPR) repeat protein
VNCSVRSFIIFLFIFIIPFLPFFTNTGFGLDSLKVGLVFQAPDQDQVDSLSNQFIRLFRENSHVNLVSIEMGDSITFEPFAIDSVNFSILKQQQFRGLILFKVPGGKSINTLEIKAFVFDNLEQTKFEEVDLDQENLSDRLIEIVREIKAFFQHQKDSKNIFRIIYAPMRHSESDSSQFLFQRSLFDTLKKISSAPLFSKIEFVSYDINSSDLSNWNDSLLQKFGESDQAHLIMAGKIDKDEEQNDLYHPHLMIPKQNDTQNPFYTDDRFLFGKTCHINQFDLPAVSFKNIVNITDVIKGYFLMKEKKYSNANEHLKNLQSFTAHFFLAESYFYHGSTIEHNPSLSQADWDSSIFYWKKCLSQTDSHRDSICSYNNIGVAFQLSGKIDSAVVYFTKANSDWTQPSDNNDFIQISHNLGNIFLLNGQWKKALDVFQSTVLAMEQSNDSLSLAITYENLGHIYQLIYQRNKAISYYHKAWELREKMQDEAGMANSLMFLGNAYLGNKEFQLAKDYFKQSLAFNLIIHHEPQLASAYDNLGQVFQNSGELDSALIYFRKSYETFDMLDDKNGLVQTMLHQASVYQKQRESGRAISLYEKALEMIGNNNSNSVRAQIYDRMGDIYNNQNNLIPALDYYQQAANIYEKAGNFEILSLIFYSMGLVKLKQNDYEKGYQLLKRAITIDEQHGFNNLSAEKEFLNQLEGILKKE